MIFSPSENFGVCGKYYGRIIFNIIHGKICFHQEGILVYEENIMVG